MNPYQPPAVKQDTTRSFWSLFVVFVILLVWSSLIIVSTYFFGAHGFGFAAYAVVGSWFIMSRMESRMLWPINKMKPTPTECAVVLAICGVLHGLTLPAVETNCIGRRRLIMPPPTAIPTPQSNGTNATGAPANESVE